MAGIKKTRKAARKRVTKRRRSGLKIKSTAKKLLRRMFRMRGGEDQSVANFKIKMNASGYKLTNELCEAFEFYKKFTIEEMATMFDSEFINKLLDANKTAVDEKCKGIISKFNALKFYLKMSNIKDAEERYKMLKSTIGTTFKGQVIRFGYCAFSVKIIDKPELSDKVLFLQKYSPFYKPEDPDQTSKPLYENTSKNPVNLTPDEKDVTVDDYKNFWKNNKLGESNLPIFEKDMGLNLGDIVTITHIEDGLKTKAGHIISNTENYAWIVKVIAPNGKEYNMFLTNDIMPQKALDIIVAWNNRTAPEKGVRYQVNARGANTEIPSVYATTAGEHLEPGDYMNRINKFDPNNAVWRAIREEFTSTPERIFFENGQLKSDTNVYVTRIDTYNSPGRDFRYAMFNLNGKQFGFDRVSSSECYLVYVDTNVEPDLAAGTDTEETDATRKLLIGIDKIKTIPDNKFMFPEHKTMFIDASTQLEKLNKSDAMKFRSKIQITQDDATKIIPRKK